MVEVEAPAGRDEVDSTRSSSGSISPRLLVVFGGRFRLFPRRPAMVNRRIPSSDPLGCIARSSNLCHEQESFNYDFLFPSMRLTHRAAPR